jgi:hypothetical protein
MPARAALAALVLASSPALASPELADPSRAPKPAAGCHCYRDRTYLPDRPAAADPYILATARSSLLSSAFGVPKRELVQASMTGTPPEDQWIAHWAAARAGTTADALLAKRRSAGSWKAALATATLADGFRAALARGAPDGELAAIAVDDVLAARLGARADELRALRAAGASSEETVAAIVLAARLGRPARAILASVRAREATWGSLVDAAGVAPRDLDDVIRARVAPGR